MDDWLLSALAEKRKARALTETARQVGIEPTRLSRIANQYVEPTAKEIEALKAFLKPVATPAAETAPAPAPAPAPAAPAPAAKPVAPAAPAAAAKPATPAPSVVPKPLPSTARLSSGLAAMKLPVQTTQTDFIYRQELLKFIFAVRDWPTQHSHPLPGDFAYLQSLWNEAQKAINAVNVRLYGEAGKPIPQPSLKPKAARRHHSSRFVFMSVAEARLPAEVVANIRESAQEGLKNGAAQGFLEAFQLAAEAILDEEDFKTLSEEAKQRAENPEE
ncbi:MAG TPA: hypothetical protein VK163_03305 [Opitutaceae bacterium]|nr:hypothetical protein [Opitutaceae bacterium]